MIPAEAVEEVAAILYDIGEHQNTHSFDAVHDILREDAKRILEAAAPHMLAGAFEEAAEAWGEAASWSDSSPSPEQVQRWLRSRANAQQPQEPA